SGQRLTAPPSLLPVRTLEGHGRIGRRPEGKGPPVKGEATAHLGLELPEAHRRRIAPGSEIVRILDDFHHRILAAAAAAGKEAFGRARPTLPAAGGCIRRGSMGPPLPTSKAEVREQVWRAMAARGVARFPGARGRIPNFVGAERAALHLTALRAWRDARILKINPDAPQLPVRRMALREGKVVYMPVPRLQALDCFLELDPDRLGSRATQAASIKGAERFGRRVRLEDVPAIDLIVCGAVAVNGKGARVGKGGGFSDLEYGLLAET